MVDSLASRQPRSAGGLETCDTTSPEAMDIDNRDPETGGLTRRNFVGSAAAAMLVGGCAKAAVPAETGIVNVPANFFGIHVNNASPNGLWKQNQTPLPHIGAKAIRLWDTGTNWRNVNPSPGVFDFSRLDYRLDMAKAMGCEVMLTLGQAPDWAASSQGASRLGNPNPPYRIEDWNAYVQTVASRYRDRIDYFEIWNEPDLKAGYTGSLQSLLQMAESAHGIIKATAPSAKVMTPAFSMPFFRKFAPSCGLKDWVEAGGLRFCDAISVHAYSGDGFQPEGVLDWLDVVHDLLKQHGASHIPVHDTESGGRGWRDRGGELRNIAKLGFNDPLPTEPVDLQSAWVTRQLICSAISNLRQSYFYTFDNPSGQAGTQSVMAIHMTDYPHRPGQLFAPALAYRYIADLLPGATLQRYSSGGNLFSVRFATRDGRRGTIYWTPDYKNEVVSIAGAREVRDNLGKRVNVAQRLPVGPSPLFVFDG